MVKCFFCGTESSIHQGVHLINNDGSISYFCSSKCRKNFDMGRDKKKLKWTEAFRIVQQKAKKSEALKAEKAVK